MKRFNIAIPSIVFTLSVAATTVQAAIPNYLISSDLGVMTPIGMNNSGQVIGYSSNVNYIVTGGVATAITISGGGGVKAINDSGQVVGVGYSGSAFSYQSGVVSSLGANSSAYGINNSGVIAGSAAFNYAGPSYPLSEAALHQGGAWQNLDPTFINFGSAAIAVNNNGVAAGWTSYNPSVNQAAIFSNGAIQNIGTLGGRAAVATSINDSGVTVGWSILSGPQPQVDGPTHAFIYSNGILQDLGGMGGAVNYISSANDINNLGLVVGDYNSRAFLYSQTDGLTDLNSLLINNLSGITLSNAVAINDRGDILAQGIDGHAYILVNAVPVPAAAWLFTSALFSVGCLKYRRKTRASARRV